MVQKFEISTKIQCAPKDFELSLEDFPQLHRILRVRNSLFFSKSIMKVVSTSSFCPGKRICDSNVPPSKHVNASFVRTSKPISNRSVRPNETVSASSVSLIFVTSARAS